MKINYNRKTKYIIKGSTIYSMISFLILLILAILTIYRNLNLEYVKTSCKIIESTKTDRFQYVVEDNIMTPVFMDKYYFTILVENTEIELEVDKETYDTYSLGDSFECEYKMIKVPWGHILDIEKTKVDHIKILNITS